MLLLAAGHFGTIPQWLTIVTLVGLAWFLRGGQMGPANSWLREANTTLREETEALRQRLAEERKANAILSTKTDLEPLQVALVQEIKEHARQTEQEHKAMLVGLNLIAQRLGPEPNGD